MIDTNLIFVDGICGSGKSTTAQLLAVHIERLGYDAKWIFEHEVPHPVYEYEEIDQARIAGVSAVRRVLASGMASWVGLAATLRETDSIRVMDSALLQTAAATMLSVNMAMDEIVEHIVGIQKVVADLHPVLIYFYQDNVAGATRTMFDRRGPDFEKHLVGKLIQTPYIVENGLKGFDGAVHFFTAYRDMANRLFSELDMLKVAIENTAGDWQEYYRQIVELLSVPPFDHSCRPVNDLYDFVGIYQAAGSPDKFAVTTECDSLFLNDGIKRRLIHKTGNAFCVEGMCIDIQFSGEHGEIDRVMFTGNLPNLNRNWRRI